MFGFTSGATASVPGTFTPTAAAAASAASAASSTFLPVHCALLNLPLEEVMCPFSSLSTSSTLPDSDSDSDSTSDFLLNMYTIWDVLSKYSAVSPSTLVLASIVRANPDHASPDCAHEPTFHLLLSLANESTFASFSRSITSLNKSIHLLLYDTAMLPTSSPSYAFTRIKLADPTPLTPSPGQCMVCLEDLEDKTLDETSPKGLLTTVCRHTFHVECLRKWCGAPCPVCRFDLSATLGETFETIPAAPHPDTAPHPDAAPHPANESMAQAASSSSQRTPTSPQVSPHKNHRGTMCLECRRQKVPLVSLPSSPLLSPSLPPPPPNPGFWVCLICGTCSCGGFPAPNVNVPNAHNHASEHFKDTLHAYAVEVGTQKVWDFAGMGFVHRLVSNDRDGKMVEIAEPGGGGVRPLAAPVGEGEGELLWHTKLEGLAQEYNGLLRGELEKQRATYLEQMGLVKRFGKRDQKVTVLDALRKEEEAMKRKFEGTRKRHAKVVAERDFVKELVGSLKANRGGEDARVKRAERELKVVQDMRNDLLPGLAEKVEKLMLKLDGGG